MTVQEQHAVPTIGAERRHRSAHGPSGSDSSDGLTADEDPTRLRNQPALTTSTGLVWLIVGGLLAATGIAILVPMLELGLPILAATGIVLLAGLYAVMWVARVTTHPGRVRLAIMAITMLAIAAVALVCVGVITAIEWNIIR